MDKFTALYFCTMTLNHNKNTNTISSTSGNKVFNYWLMFVYSEQTAASSKMFPIWFLFQGLKFRQNVAQIRRILNYCVSTLVYTIHNCGTICQCICCARALMTTVYTLYNVDYAHSIINPQQDIYRPFSYIGERRDREQMKNDCTGALLSIKYCVGWTFLTNEFCAQSLYLNSK